MLLVLEAAEDGLGLLVALQQGEALGPGGARGDPAGAVDSGVDPWVLAAIGWIETQHGQSTAPGVRSGVNAFGCCAGPIQLSIVGAPSTWQSFGVDGNRDGRRSPYDPADAIPPAARYLRASGRAR